jgi:hypothetical protein
MSYEYELEEQDRQEIVAGIVEEIKERRKLVKGFIDSQRNIMANTSLQRLIVTESTHPDTTEWLTY